MNDRQPGRPATDALRQAAVDALADAFAQDAIGLDEFERRVELAHRTETEEELRVLLSDLPAAHPPVRASGRSPAEARPPDLAPHPVPAPDRSMPAHLSDQSFVVGCLGGASRKGRWIPARSNWAIGVLGGVELDFRECPLPPGVTEVRCFTCMGGVELVVPPDVIVETSGVGLMGGFEHTARDTVVHPDAPVLRITGWAILGGVSVSVRYPGETAGDAKRRRRDERRQMKRLRRGGR